jgi:hypothetical protein
MPLPIHKFAQRFFGFGESPKTIKIILPGLPKKRETSLQCANYPLFEYEIAQDDMLSALRIHSLLTSIYGEIVEVYSHNAFILKPIHNNIFIGGPPTNPFSYQAVKNAPIQFGDDQVNRVIYGKENSYKIGFSSKDQELRRITEDYSLISKRKKNENIEFVIAGLRAYGQVATYNFLNEEDFYRQVEEVTRHDSFQVLVKIVVEGKACVGWEVVEKTSWEPDISDPGGFSSIIQQKREKGDFDIFLSYNSKDKSEVKKIGENLMESGILPWFDEWELKPGMSWLRALENQIKKIKAAAVFIGKNGRGPWQEEEIEGFISEFKARKCPIIPVILPDCREVPDLPFYLKGKVIVDFRDKEPDPLKQLIEGIPV